MFDLKLYENIIFDFDGVVVDSNIVKKESITKVAKNYLEEKKLKQFITYFTENNGLPREIKIKKYFPKNWNEVLKKYNSILKIELKKIKFTECFLELLDKLNQNLYILSGGDEKEIKKFLLEKNIDFKFVSINGAPKTKSENFDNLKLRGNILYIGDSKLDYQLAQKYNLDFIFMYGYTQFFEWEQFFRNNKDVIIMKNFCEFNLLKGDK